jgi:hypothetical protein
MVIYTKKNATVSEYLQGLSASDRAMSLPWWYMSAVLAERQVTD